MGSVCFYSLQDHHEYISYIFLFFIFYFIFGGTKILHYVIFYLVFGGTKRAQFASPHLTSPWIYILSLLFFISYSVVPKSYIMLFFISYSVTPNGLSLLLLPPGSPWIYILHFLIFYFLFHIRWHQNLTLCYFLFSFQWQQKGSVCFTPSNITMNICLML